MPESKFNPKSNWKCVIRNVHSLSVQSEYINVSVKKRKRAKKLYSPKHSVLCVDKVLWRIKWTGVNIHVQHIFCFFYICKHAWKPCIFLPFHKLCKWHVDWRQTKSTFLVILKTQSAHSPRCNFKWAHFHKVKGNLCLGTLSKGMSICGSNVRWNWTHNFLFSPTTFSKKEVVVLQHTPTLDPKKCNKLSTDVITHTLQKFLYPLEVFPLLHTLQSQTSMHSVGILNDRSTQNSNQLWWGRITILPQTNH